MLKNAPKSLLTFLLGFSVSWSVNTFASQTQFNSVEPKKTLQALSPLLAYHAARQSTCETPPNKSSATAKAELELAQAKFNQLTAIEEEVRNIECDMAQEDFRKNILESFDLLTDEDLNQDDLKEFLKFLITPSEKKDGKATTRQVLLARLEKIDIKTLAPLTGEDVLKSLKVFTDLKAFFKGKLKFEGRIAQFELFMSERNHVTITQNTLSTLQIQAKELQWDKKPSDMKIENDVKLQLFKELKIEVARTKSPFTSNDDIALAAFNMLTIYTQSIERILEDWKL